MLSIPNTTTAAAYNTPGATTTFPPEVGAGTPFVQGFLVIANATVFVSVLKGRAAGQAVWTPDVLQAPSLLPIAVDRLATPGDRIFAVRFRDGVSGTHAQVFGALFQEGEVAFTPGTEFTTKITAGGGSGSPVANIVPTPLASFPPAGPVDGDLCVLELPATFDPLGGKKLRWMLSYNAGDAVWDAITGAGLYAEVLTLETSSSTVYGDLTTVGPSITLPRPGDYEVTVGASMDIVQNVAGCTGLMAYQGAGIAAASDNDAAISGQANAVVNRYPGGASVRTREKVGLTTASALVAKYRIITGNSVDFQSRFMVVRPLRLT